MANELDFPYDAGNTLYVRIYDSTGQLWNTSGTPAFEAWNGANVTDYDIALTDKSSGQYLGDWPSAIADGDYSAYVFKQAGASPATTDPVIGRNFFTVTWDGTIVIPPATEDDMILNIYDERT
jgi:hypothetical protein